MEERDERRYEDGEQIALGFGHVERRLDDLETALAEILAEMANAETPEERREALIAAATPTMRVRLERLGA